MTDDETRARVADWFSVVNEGLKAGHKAGVHGCGLIEAAALEQLAHGLIRTLDESEAARAAVALHPNGRCGCCGEGRCQWCLLMQACTERDAAQAAIAAAIEASDNDGGSASDAIQDMLALLGAEE